MRDVYSYTCAFLHMVVIKENLPYVEDVCRLSRVTNLHFQACQKAVDAQIHVPKIQIQTEQLRITDF